MTAPEYTRLTLETNERAYKINADFPGEPWCDDTGLRCRWEKLPVGTRLRLKESKEHAGKPGHTVLVFARDDIDDGSVCVVPETRLTTEYFRLFEDDEPHHR